MPWHLPCQNNMSFNELMQPGAGPYVKDRSEGTSDATWIGNFCAQLQASMALHHGTTPSLHQALAAKNHVRLQLNTPVQVTCMGVCNSGASHLDASSQPLTHPLT